MLGIIKEINGQKKIIPLTTDIGTGAPVGTLIQQYKKKPMSGYLYCDGSTFDENAYPALYMYLGTNVLPDYRECVMVGAEQNTTDTIEAHDVYGEGEFKDDQLQTHEHDISRNADGKPPYFYQDNGKGEIFHGALTTTKTGKDATPIATGVPAGRHGDTTHGKQKAVYVYIKATSGLAENQQDNVLNDVKGYVDSSNSYSTNEIKTGGKWIDGKPIYRKVVNFGALPNATTKEVAHGVNNIGDITHIYGVAHSSDRKMDIPLPYARGTPVIIYATQNDVAVEISNTDYMEFTRSEITIEYTKTTD